MNRLKYIPIVILIFIVQITYAQSTSTIFTYSISSKKVGADILGVLQRMESMSHDLNQIEISLYVKDDMTTSVYHDAQKSEGNYGFSWGQLLGNEKSYICNSLSDSTISFSTIYDSTVFHVSKQYDLLSWELIDESKVINGVGCKKAIKRSPLYSSDRIIETLWFSDGTNALIGPMDYVGFPGQVIQVITDYYDINLIYTEIDKPQFVNCALDGEEIEYKELQKLKSKTFWDKHKNK